MEGLSAILVGALAQLGLKFSPCWPAIWQLLRCCSGATSRAAPSRIPAVRSTPTGPAPAAATSVFDQPAEAGALHQHGGCDHLEGQVQGPERLIALCAL